MNGERAKLYYIDTGSFIAYIKTEKAKYIKERFYTLNYKLERSLLKGKSKKVIELMKYGLGGKIMTEFTVLRPKLYSCLTDKNDKDKKKS